MLDERDRRILGALALDARTTYKELGALAGLSANATAERVQRLVASGVVLKFSIEVAGAAVGRPLQAYIDVRLQPGTTMADFENAIQKMESIQEATVLTGTFDARLRVATSDPAGLNRVIETLRSSCGVLETCCAVICQQLQLRPQGTQGGRLPLR